MDPYQIATDRVSDSRRNHAVANRAPQPQRRGHRRPPAAQSTDALGEPPTIATDDETRKRGLGRLVRGRR